MNIEELAFKNRKSLAKLNELDLLDIIEFLQDDRKQWINQFSKTHNENVEIQKENKQLKERIEYLERSNNRREDIILEQRQEISNLEDTCCNRTDCSSRIKDSKKYDSLKQKYEKQVDNWNKLKEIIRKKQDYYRHFKDNRYRKFLSELLDIMQELEQGSDK